MYLLTSASKSGGISSSHSPKMRATRNMIADDLLLTATGLSGRTGFEEVIDDYQAAHIEDPLQAQILKVLDGADGKNNAA
jgi:hypothetical protein